MMKDYAATAWPALSYSFAPTATKLLLAAPYVLRLRARSARLERGEKGFGVGQPLEPLELVADRVELADQQARRGAVAVGRPVGVDDNDAAAALEVAVQVPEEFVGLLDLVIHVDHQNAVERGVGELRIVGQPDLERDVGEPLALHPPGKLLDRRRDDVLGEDAAVAADDRRQPHRIIAFAGADVGDRHSRPDLGEADDRLELADAVAGVLIQIARGDDRRHRPPRLGEGRARRRRLVAAAA